MSFFDSDIFYDAIWVVIVIGLLGLPLVVAAKIDADIDKHLRREEARLSKLGRTYSASGQLRPIFLWLTITVLLTWAFFSLPAEGSDQIGLNLGMLLLLGFILLIGVPIVLPGLGIVALGEEAAYTSWLGRRKQLRYDEIEHVCEYFWLIPPHIKLRGNGTSIYINRWAGDLRAIYSTLGLSSANFRRIVQPDVRAWKLTRAFWLWQAGGLFTVYAVLMGGLVFFGVTQTTMDAEGWSVLITLALFFGLIFGGAFYFAELKPKMPSALAFEGDTLRVRIPFKGWRAVPRSDIQEVTQTSEDRTVRSKGITVTAKEYPVVIKLKDGTELKIDERRAVQFGTSTHVMYAQIQRILDA